MSTFLYRLGRSCYLHHRRVVGAWLAVLVVMVGLAVMAGGRYNDDFTIPGAPAQMALDRLRLTFPAAAAQSATAVVVVPQGHKVSDPAIKKEIEAAVTSLGKVAGVSTVTSPWNEHISGLVSDDGRAALIDIQLTAQTFADITTAERNALTSAADQSSRLLPAGSSITMGGQAFSIEVPGIGITDAVGLVVALVVLILTLGSALAAGIPILTALIGVGLSTAVMFVATRLMTVNSTTPILSVMLGLAVGIDYALFIASRHRDQLRTTTLGPDPNDALAESAARAVATAGSAVVFAGLTVMIALVGLCLANIPFLSVMGVFAALGIAFAVMIALTMLPALMGFLGVRLVPKRRPRRALGASERTRRRTVRARASAAHDTARSGVPADTAPAFFGRWVRAVIRWPVVTIAVVLLALGALSWPARNLQLALPNSGEHKLGQTDRKAYDIISQFFGPGANGPLIVTADILGSTDPLGVMSGIKKDIEAIPGVKLVPLSTPNQNADTGFVQVVPTTGPADPATATLVSRLRDKAASWQQKYGVDTAVTGSTAIQIDVSRRLASALIPFGIFVVGLSVVLLMMVFRSIWVPVKATLGYLLSIGASFGATQLVFNQGVGRRLINLERAGPIIAFLPIITMGILFGLAMDYEVFLVSRMREEWVHGRPDAEARTRAHEAIVNGFVHSGKVVLAAALIMFSVFAFFIPEGSGPIKPIAFSLAFGVAVDAFVVRMTLVPAVLALLGPHAWSLPAWLDKRLPSFDVEGASLRHQLDLAAWPTPEHTELLHAEGFGVPGVAAPVDAHLDPGQVAFVVGDAVPRRGLMLALAGRLRGTEGEARVTGHLLPELAAQVRRDTGLVDLAASRHAQAELTAMSHRSRRLVFVDAADTLAESDDLAALSELVTIARAAGSGVVIGVTESASLRWLHPDSVLHARSDDTAGARGPAASPASPTPYADDLTPAGSQGGN